MALCDADPPSSRSADFLNKVTIPCPNNLSLYLLACRVVSSTSLDSVTPWARCTQPINTVQLAKRSRKKKSRIPRHWDQYQGHFLLFFIKWPRSQSSHFQACHQSPSQAILVSSYLLSDSAFEVFLGPGCLAHFCSTFGTSSSVPLTTLKIIFQVYSRSLGRLHFSSQMHCICSRANPSCYFVSSLKAKDHTLFNPISIGLDTY